MKELEQGWQKAADKIADVPVSKGPNRGDNLFLHSSEGIGCREEAKVADWRWNVCFTRDGGHVLWLLEMSAKCHKRTSDPKRLECRLSAKAEGVRMIGIGESKLALIHVNATHKHVT